ncbi:MAG: hypothetical protein JNM12_09205 [Alphaproteobacteria bacterium]|nr:hypothetical protein [Alphaproteobacteria bacterium]
MAGTGNTAPHSAGATVKQKIAATFELFFLFGRGIKPFEKEGTKYHALRSLWLPVVAAPLAFYSAWLYPPQGLEKETYSTIASVLAGFTIVSFVVGTALGYLFSWAFDRRERFWLWFHVGNWMTVPNTLIAIPILALAVLGNHERDVMDRAFSIVLYYGVIVNACVAFRAFKVDWTLAGFFACMSIYAAQQVWNLMFWLNDVPIKWFG